MFFADPPFGKTLTQAKTINRWKGQKEIRVTAVSSDPELLMYIAWPGLTHIWQQTKTVIRQGKSTTEVSVGIACIPDEIRQDTIAGQIANYIRGHWGIENRLHRQRDMVFREDRTTIRKGSAPQIMAATKNIVLSIFHRATVRNFKTAQRRFAAHPEELFAFLGLTKIQNAYEYV